MNTRLSAKRLFFITPSLRDSALLPNDPRAGRCTGLGPNRQVSSLSAGILLYHLLSSSGSTPNTVFSSSFL